MSKASQRKLAEQQKRHKTQKQKDPIATAADDFMNLRMGDRFVRPLKYWSAVCKLQHPDEVPCSDEDYKRLSEALDRKKDLLAAWAGGWKYASVVGTNFANGPGMVIIHTPNTPMACLPLNPMLLSYQPQEVSALVDRILDATQRCAPLSDNSILLVSLLSSSQRDLMTTLVMSPSGACMSAVFTCNSWIYSRYATAFKVIYDDMLQEERLNQVFEDDIPLSEIDLNKLLASEEVRADASPALISGLGAELNSFIAKHAGHYLQHSLRLAKSNRFAQAAHEHLYNQLQSDMENERAHSRKTMKGLQDQLDVKATEIVKLKTEISMMKKKPSSAPVMTSTPELVSAQARHADPRPHVNAKMLSFFDM